MAQYTMYLNATEIDLAVSGAYDKIVVNGGLLVYLDGNQTISGIKTFKSGIKISEAPPSSGSAVGEIGQIAFGTGGIYGCTGTNSWGYIPWQTF